jgi:phage tail-like protein
VTRSSKADPVRNFKFQVQINVRSLGDKAETAIARAGFMSVSGLGVTTEVIPYREGGFNTTVHKLPGQSDFPPIQLQRGVFGGVEGSASWSWFKKIFFYQMGQGTGAGPDNDFRGNMIIRVLDHPVTKGGPKNPSTNTPGGITKAAFKIHNCWPTTLQFSDLDAGGNAVFVEQMTLAHEGIEPAFAQKGKYITQLNPFK